MNIVYVVVYDKLLLYAIRSRVRFCRQQRLSLNRMTEWQFQIVITAQGVIIEKFWQMFPWLFKKAFYFSFRLNYTTLEYTQAGQKNKQILKSTADPSVISINPTTTKLIKFWF